MPTLKTKQEAVPLVSDLWPIAAALLAAGLYAHGNLISYTHLSPFTKPPAGYRFTDLLVLLQGGVLHTRC